MKDKSGKQTVEMDPRESKTTECEMTRMHIRTGRWSCMPSPQLLIQSCVNQDSVESSPVLAGLSSFLFLH